MKNDGDDVFIKMTGDEDVPIKRDGNDARWLFLLLQIDILYLY